MKFAQLLMAAAIACAATACSDNDTDTSLPTDVCYDFVTYEGYTSNGSEFTLRKSGDSELVTYYCTSQLPSSANVSVGERLIIMYAPQNGTAYLSGPITLYGYRLLDQTQNNLVLTDSVGASIRQSGDISLITLTRTGEYVNLQANLACQTTSLPKALYMATDSLKMGNEYPEINLIYIPTADGMNYYGAYASFDVSAVWDQSSCKGIVVNYMTGSGTQSMTFTKTNGFLPSN
ncbi:MAG: hypothetical protein LUD17_06455 [Bacteroidales bacterium]|nr:hypothetical protein [Bacteroidales bacterium]